MKKKLTRLVKEGKSTREMATELSMSQTNVRYHLKKHGLFTDQRGGRPKGSGTKGNAVKEAFLGMPYGTAGHRLRKMLLFKYVSVVNDGTLTCWDCKKQIDTVEEFSVQHKKPWLHEDAKLFWDLNNITFSHLKCNKTDRNRNAEKTHCPRGHPYSGDNLIVRKEGRICRKCRDSKYKGDCLPTTLAVTKSEFLGLPYGTAFSRLRQMLLFKYVTKSQETKYIECWDCGNAIKEVTDFSMQHKKPWLHEDVKLFWDLDNVDFSHCKCNKPDRNRQAEKTHCPKGHPYSGENLLYNHKPKVYRSCRICVNIRDRERKRKARAKDPKYGR